MHFGFIQQLTRERIASLHREAELDRLMRPPPIYAQQRPLSLDATRECAEWRP